MHAWPIAPRCCARRFEVASGDRRRDLVGHPLLLLDVPVRSTIEQRFVVTLVGRSPRALVTVPLGDDRSIPEASGVVIVDDDRPAATALDRLQAGLFSPTAVPGESGRDVLILSAPGENRECVEIARELQREAERGTPFDRMAILLRSPQQYRGHLEEALRRASIPVHFARGTKRPDPSGRAFLALLGCAAEGLSARRFAEYLSLGEVADAETEGAPPSPNPRASATCRPTKRRCRRPSPALRRATKAPTTRTKRRSTRRRKKRSRMPMQRP